MAARRGKSQARRNSGPRGVPPWLWMLAGLLLGLALAAVVLVRDGFDARRLLPRPNPAAEAPREPEPPVAQKADPAARKPKFDFYTVLPEREVQIPDAELTAKARVEPAAPPPSTERLLLQAGSFAEARRAEEVKASIAFTGLVARVEPTSTRGGTTVHRVMLGPFGSLRELDAAKQQLAGSGIEAIAIREPARP
jgi:cell division protein FtsN